MLGKEIANKVEELRFEEIYYSPENSGFYLLELDKIIYYD